MRTRTATSVVLFAVIAAVFATAGVSAGQGVEPRPIFDAPLNHPLDAGQSVVQASSSVEGEIIYSVGDGAGFVGLWRTDYQGNATQIATVAGDFELNVTGSHSVFVADPDGDASWDLYSVATDGSGTTILAAGFVTAADLADGRGSFALARDGQDVVFQQRDASNRHALWAVPTAGGVIRRLSADVVGFGDVATDFGVSGRSFNVVYMIETTTTPEIHRVHVSSATDTVLSAADEFYGLSPDSHNIVYRLGDSIEVAPVSGLDPLLIGLVEPGHTVVSVTVSPDSTKLAYRSQDPVTSDVMLYSNLSDGTVRQVAAAVHPSYGFSHDSHYLFFAVVEDGVDVVLRKALTDPTPQVVWDGDEVSHLLGVTLTDIVVAKGSAAAVLVLDLGGGVSGFGTVDLANGVSRQKFHESIVGSSETTLDVVADHALVTANTQPGFDRNLDGHRRLYSVRIPSGSPRPASRIDSGDADLAQVAPGRELPGREIVVYLADAAFPGTKEIYLARVEDEFCDGRYADIFGTDSSDVIVGTDGPDVIHGGDGDDLIRGRGGDDVICGGWGSDELFGNRGNDRLFLEREASIAHGGKGHDYIQGSSRGDTLYGGKGADTILGESGDDTIYGRQGKDVLRGGPNNDSIYGGIGDDIVDGGDHEDLLFGGDGNDRIWGKYGDDTLDGGADIDTCNGGAGTDTTANCEDEVLIP